MQSQFRRICLNKLNNRHCSTGTVKSSACSKKIYNHFQNNDQLSNLDLFPSDFKRITSKKDTELYVADNDAASVIAKAIARYRMESVPFFEINPGPCILSNALLRHLRPKRLGLLEKNKEFHQHQQKFIQFHQKKVLPYPTKQRCTHYTSITNFIRTHSEKQKWHDDVICQLFMYLQPMVYFRIISDVIKQRRLFANGRVDIFAIVPAVEFMRMTANPDSKYWLYTQKSCIFQILFEYEQLAEFHKESFLPWYIPKQAYGGKLEYDNGLFYLVRMTPRRNLFSMCNPDDLPLLRFFVNQCLFRRKGYIISKLEQWIPGIGVDLITSKFEQLSQDEPNNTNLMHHQLRNHTFHTFTECGSLTPLQICAMFQFFQKSSEYTTSCFHQQCKDFYTSKSPQPSTAAQDNDPHSDDEIGSGSHKNIDA